MSACSVVASGSDAATIVFCKVIIIWMPNVSNSEMAKKWTIILKDTNHGNEPFGHLHQTKISYRKLAKCQIITHNVDLKKGPLKQK